MCGAFELHPHASRQPWPAGVPQSGTFRPTNTIAIIDAEGLILPARWWLVPNWHKGDVSEWKATTFNARIETAHEKPTFRAAWRYHRCLIPASNYIEFTGDRSPKKRWYIAPQSVDEAGFYMAGLYSYSGDVLTATIVTRAANETIEHIHPRMPVILDVNEQSAWLNNDEDRSTIGAHTPLVAQADRPTQPQLL